MTPDAIESIRKRQQARFLDHLRRTGQATPQLERDLCRMLHYFSDDVQTLVKSTENTHESHKR